MSTSPAQTPQPGTRPVDTAQYGLAAFLVIVGGYVVYDATGLRPGFADQPVQPSAFPYVVGAGLLVLGVLLAIATRRGDRPEAEEGEDVDLTRGTDLRTVGLLAGVFVVVFATIGWLGWPICSAFLFAASARVLGSRHLVRDVAIGAALALATFYGFYVGLNVPVPAGILDGVL